MSDTHQAIIFQSHYIRPHRGRGLFWVATQGWRKNPDLGNERLQGVDGEFPDDVSQFTTKMINDPDYHDILTNLSDQPSDEEPPEAIS